MARTIENNIHFIWVGGVIPEKYVLEIIRCVEMNTPNYQVYLWTDNPSENGAQMQKVGVNHCDNRKGLSGLDSSLEFGDATRSSLKINYTTSKRPIFGRREDTTSALALTIVDIDELKDQLNSLMRRYNEAMDPGIRNYGRASDILRLGVLHMVGGVYMDIDVQCLKPLPADLTAEDGFLVGFGQAGRASFTNAVMAAPAGSDFIDRLISSIEDMYTFWEERNWWHANDEDVRRLRTEHGNAKKLNEQEPSASNASEVHRKRSQYQEAMEAGTLPITGPTRVELFMYKRLLKDQAQDPLQFFADVMPLAAQNPISFNTTLGHFKVSLKKQMEDAGVHEIYDFPMEYINIRSDASWM